MFRRGIGRDIIIIGILDLELIGIGVAITLTEKGIHIHVITLWDSIEIEPAFE